MSQKKIGNTFSIIAMVIDMDTAITENQTWMTFTLFSVENTI